MSENGIIHISMMKTWVSHMKKGEYRIPGSAEKGAIRHAHPYYVIYPRYGFFSRTRPIVDLFEVEMCYEICMFTPLYLYMLTIYYVGRGRYNVVITCAAFMLLNMFYLNK